MKQLLVAVISTLPFSVCTAQTQVERFHLDSATATALVQQALQSEESHNFLDGSPEQIDNEGKAVAVAESHLFPIYGRRLILQQKPYDVFHIDRYWLISGTLEKGSIGGTFLIILRDTDGAVIQLSHGE